MYKTTFGPRIHYVITLSLIFLTLSSWTGGNLLAQISITTDSTTNVSCHSEADGAINISVTGGDNNYAYSWSGPNGYSSTIQDISGLTSGSYNINVSDASGNSATESFQIDQPTALTATTPTTTPVSCNGGSDGTITAGTTSGGNGGYSYSINGTTFQTTNNFDNLTAGNYTITIKDSKDCQITQNITINEPTVLSATTPTTTPVSCNGASDGTITIGTPSGGNGGYSYSINGTTFQTANNFNNITAGNYTITIKDSKDCQVTQNITVNEPTVLTATAPTTSPVSCNGGSDGTITAGTPSGGNGGYSYSINGTTFQTANNFNNITAGNYTITIKDSKDCQVTQNITVNEPTVLTATAPTTSPVSCNGGSDGTITAGTPSGGNGGYSYSINGTTFQTANNFNNITAGNYTITIKDSKDCQVTQNITVNEPTVLTATAPTTSPVSCNGGSDGTITAGTPSGGNGGYSYSINGTTFQTANNFNNLTAGNYTITISDSKDCQVTQNINVNEPTTLTATAPTTTPVSCNGGSDGTITAGTPSGGNGSYSYAINNGQFGSNNIFSNLSSGTHTLKIKDFKGCEIVQTVQISQPDVLTISTSSKMDVTCFGGTDGTITAGTVTGGTAPYQYSIDNTNFSSSANFNNLSAGDYTIFVKDANNCALQASLNISQPSILNSSISKTNVSCHSGNDGAILFSQASGGSGNYEYSINGTTWQTTGPFNNLQAGIYTTYIRDASNINCEKILGDIEVTQPTAPISVNITTTRTTSFGSPTGTATANASGGTPGYTYEWRQTGNNAIIQTTKTANNLNAGTYEVTIIDTKGCSKIESVSIIDALQASIASRSICEDVENQDAIRTSFYEVNDRTAYGGVPPYTYNWDFGTGATNPSRTGVGEHTVYYNSTGNKTITLTVTDSKGESIVATQQNYVGNCYEPCGKSENFVFDPNNIYIGDVNGNPVNITTINNCTNTVDKYIFIRVDKSANAYNPYVELIYKVSNPIVQTASVHFASGCREGDDIDDDPNDNKENKIGEFIKLTLNPIDFDCGDNLDIENFYVTWTNVGNKKCGQNNNAFCFSSNEPIIVPTPLRAEATAENILCKGASTGAISTVVSGGYAPYNFNLTGHNDPYQDSKTFNNLPAGTYTVYVRDSRNNTTESNVVVVDEPNESISLTTSVNDPACFGEKGSATVTATGGTPGTSGNSYQYLWNDVTEQTTATATGLSPGNYTVTVIDANGCQEIASVTITEPIELTVPNAGDDQILGCGKLSTQLAGNSPTQGVGTWSIDEVNSTAGGSITDPLNPISEFTGPKGTFHLIWTIANDDGSCEKTDSVTITIEGECSLLDFDGVDDHVIFGNNYDFSTGNFSIEIWVKPETVSGLQTIFSKRNKTNLSAGGFDLIINNGSPTFRWGGKNATTSNKLTTNRWYHLAVIFSGNTAKLYVDGIEVGNNTSSNPGVIPNPFILGAMHDSATPASPTNYYSGWMEEFRLWNIALSEEQLRFMMNQRIESNGANTKGKVLPMNVPGSLSWSSLIGYYPLNPLETINGETIDISNSPLNGVMINIKTNQKVSAPLPYISEASGSWRDRATWDVNIGNNQEKWWDVPNGNGINGSKINWNIVETSHNINSTAQDIYLLGLFSKARELKINGNVPNETGQGLTVTHYLKLDGNINLEGNSQLVQTEGSILDEQSTGYIDIDQQGTANSFNYNYWTSPVSLTGQINNSGYSIKQVLMDATDPTDPDSIDFNYQFHWADGNYSGNKRISTYWLHTFKGNADDYSEWHQFSESEILEPGIGFSMKGTTGYVPVDNRQNYTFRGKPNNGNINVTIGAGQNLLTGNPYPSAIDAQKFIEENLSSFNGNLYFWDHFGPVNSHYLEEYVGGYAVYNLSGGIASASSIDSRIDDTGDRSTKAPPARYIPVGQAFFVSSIGITSPSPLTFKNKYRAFVTESSGDSQFHSQEKDPKKNQESEYEKDSRIKIRLKFESPKGYHRQILVTADAKTSGGFDLGYDAPLIENNVEDMYWMIEDTEFVIQAVPNFNLDQVLPLGIKISQEGEYTIKIDELENIETEIDIYLKDKLNNTYFDLIKGDYTATAEELGNFNDRYEIVFKSPEEEEQGGEDVDEDSDNPDKPITEKPEVLEPAIDNSIIQLDYLKGSDEISLYNPDMMTVDFVELYSISGQKIMTFTEVPTQESVLLKINQKISSAVYILRLYSGEKFITKKVIINK